MNKCSNTDHRIIKMKPVDEQPSTCIDFDTENDNEYSYFKVCDHVRIPKYKNSFGKVIFQIGQKECLQLKKLNVLFPGHMLLAILAMKKLLECLMKKIFKKQIKKSLEFKK